MRRYLKQVKRSLAVRIGTMIRNVEREIDRRTLPKFANDPKNLHFESPRRISNPERIWIGDDVSLGPGCLLSPSRQYPGAFMQGGPAVEPRQYESGIRIGDRVSATGYLTVGAASSVEIGDDVLLASHIFISDNQHGISRIDVPFKYQHLERIEPVKIGRGCWIGEHVVIMSGVTIGEMSVVGANSVVTRSIPARSIAVGSPARVIRRWDESVGTWVAVDKDGG